MTRIKICGITSVEDAMSAVDAGVDALGFCFSPGARRIAPEAARQIVEALPTFMISVGVFRNAPMDEVRETVDRVGLDCVQLDGRESASYCAGLGRCVIKRFGVADGTSIEDLRAQVQPYQVSAHLVDLDDASDEPRRYERLRGLGVRLVVAGGLTPENVAEPVRLLRPFAVSVCRGVESAPGRKDPIRLREFVQAVRECAAVCVA